MDDDHTASFISALANLQPQPSDVDHHHHDHHNNTEHVHVHDNGIHDGGLHDNVHDTIHRHSHDQDHLSHLSLSSLDGWTIDQLKIEVVRLRRQIQLQLQLQVRPHHHTHDNVIDHSTTAAAVAAAAAAAAAVSVPDSLLHSHLASFAQSSHFGVGVGVNVPGVTVGLNATASSTVANSHHHAPHLASAGTPANGHVRRKRGIADVLEGGAGAGSASGLISGVGSSSAPAPRPVPSQHSAANRKRLTKRDEGTGKRVEKGRRVELGRAIRTKMRYAMNIGLEDDLPPPTALTMPDAQPDGNGYWVPNWPAGISDSHNMQWLERVCSVFIAEARSFQAWNKVPSEDLDEETVKLAARTAFLNFAKRYMADVDPKQAEKKEKYIKNRRRWARKDLKQKRRAKAAQDPSFADVHLPPAALHMDYMSSEYSSAGEDEGEDELSPLGLSSLPDRRRSQWLDVLQSQAPDPSRAGKRGWPEGVSEKVLEVRTPTWRSARLDEIYRRLDSVSSAQAALRATPASQQPTHSNTTNTNTTTTITTTADASALDKTSGKPVPIGSNLRLGHVAPSHRRFTMPPGLKRRGHAPRDVGEGWMWASGQAGLWLPDETDADDAGVASVRATLDDVAIVVDGLEHADQVVEDDINHGVEDGGDGADGIDDPDTEGMVDSPVDALVEGWTQPE